MARRNEKGKLEFGRGRQAVCARIRQNVVELTKNVFFIGGVLNRDEGQKLRRGAPLVQITRECQRILYLNRIKIGLAVLQEQDKKS